MISGRNFSLVESLIILSIFVFIASLISSSYRKIHITIRKIHCSENMRSLFLASAQFQGDHERKVLPKRLNSNRWMMEGNYIEEHDSKAYWGRPYAPYLGQNFQDFKLLFQCPEAKAVKYIDFYPYGQYATYGFNGVVYDGQNPFFKAKAALPATPKDPAQTVLFHDAWEPMLDGNLDTPDHNDIPHLEEYRRHAGSISSMRFDGHHQMVEGKWDKRWYK